MQRIFSWPYRAILAGLYRAGVRPWQLTVTSVLSNGVVGWLLIVGRWFAAGSLLIAAGLFDIFDGAVARLRGEDSRLGAFLDSVLDRVSDAVLFGCLFWSLSAEDERLQAGLALAALLITIMVSHIRAEAESAGVSLSEGFFQRLERYLALIAGLMIPGAMLPMLMVLVGLGGITVLQRGWAAIIRVAAGSGGTGRSSDPQR